ncbi:hypothetical protein GCM10010218_37550 [Streptomyces mashuensis]|uniref:YdbS-like PH domain-containing protein n=1 Tax=Streptomyces mashuensis TaxID=33904 RepID=A0A919EEC1_9ACTN|nr:PH domain-containing protein [Streptomyces mashuensis]GHF52558.1 hypothetical protein GCM10010218_37550 [Streptomyces mashuensis]
MSSQAPTRQSADATATPWERLSGRLILVQAGLLAAPLGSFLLALAVSGGKADLQVLIALGSVLITFLVVTGIGVMRYLTTRYRIADDRIELRSGLLFRSQRAMSLDRVRSVDLTANPVHRIFGLTSVRIGTGEQTSSAGRRLTIDGVTKAQAAELRDRLLSRRTAAPGRAADDDGLIADMDWSWLRYAPLTIWGVGGVLTTFGTAYRILHEMKIDPLEFGFVKDIEDRYGSVPLWFGILVTALIVIALGAVFSTATFTEGWYGYRLEREQGGTFRVLRGMLVTRSVTIEEKRMRGVELTETMLLRWARGARVNAVASGLGDRDENSKRSMLTPPMPRNDALRVAAEVLSEHESPTLSALRRHPRITLRRRINRALTATVLLVAPLAALGLWLSRTWLYAAGITALVLLPATLAMAYDAHRALGHTLRDRYLITRSGTFARRTVALERQGVIGWNVTRSVFQRRAGLLTLGATTAAGNQCYKVRDVGVAQGLAFAEEAVPGLLAPFLEQAPSHRRSR